MVSIIVPVFNTNKNYLKKCINSILRQSYQDFEMLLVDDGSRKECAEYLDVLSEMDTRISVFHCDNNGVSSARNTGINCARGEYFAFIDADDWIEKEFLAAAVSYMERYNLDLVMGSVKCWHKSSFEIKGISGKKGISIYEENDICKIIRQIISCGSSEKAPELKNSFNGSVWCKLYRSKLVQKYRFSCDIALAEDSLFNIDVLNDAKRVGITTDIWYSYRVNDESSLKRFRKNYVFEIEKTLNAFECINKKYSNIFREEYCYRVLKEFSTMMYQYILHPEFEINIYGRYKLVHKILNRDPWKNVFETCCISGFEKKYKLEILLARYQFSMFLLLIYSLQKYRNQKVLL